MTHQGHYEIEGFSIRLKGNKSRRIGKPKGKQERHHDAQLESSAQTAVQKIKKRRRALGARPDSRLPSATRRINNVTIVGVIQW